MITEHFFRPLFQWHVRNVLFHFCQLWAINAIYYYHNAQTCNCIRQMLTANHPSCEIGGHFLDIYLAHTRKFKGGIGSFFHSCVNAMEWLPYCRSCMEASYCTFGFGAIYAHNSYRVIANMRAWFSPHGKGNLHLLSKLRYKNKVRRYNNSAPYVTARWLRQQIPTLNFLGPTSLRLHKVRAKLKLYIQVSWLI